MENADRPVLIYATFPTLEEAKRVGSTLVSQRLAACVNVFPGMISIYQWKGAQAEDNEVAMIIKTRAGLADAVMTETKKQHPHEVPALLVLPTEGGSDDYCAWIMSETKDGGV
jgi:periplasmic divalent cation tolerance protein